MTGAGANIERGRRLACGCPTCAGHPVPGPVAPGWRRA